MKRRRNRSPAATNRARQWRRGRATIGAVVGIECRKDWQELVDLWVESRRALGEQAKRPSVGVLLARALANYTDNLRRQIRRAGGDPEAIMREVAAGETARRAALMGGSTALEAGKAARAARKTYREGGPKAGEDGAGGPEGTARPRQMPDLDARPPVRRSGPTE